MALPISNRFIVANNVGASQSIALAPGEWVLNVTAPAWGSVTVQSAEIGSTDWASNHNGGTFVLTENTDLHVFGGLQYRLQVASLAGDITMKAIAVRGVAANYDGNYI
jgi:hypothetical protein